VPQVLRVDKEQSEQQDLREHKVLRVHKVELDRKVLKEI
jgi:hypothetical protein